MRAELTASERVGEHRYKFAAGTKRHVLLDLRSSIYNYPGKVLWSRIRIRNDGTVTRNAGDPRMGARAAAILCDPILCGNV